MKSDLLEALGLMCLVVAGFFINPALGFAVLGAALINLSL